MLPPLPRRPALAPGAVVVRRDAEWLEVRLSEHRAVRLPEREETRVVLDHLREHRMPPTGPTSGVLDRLLALDLLIDADLLGAPAPAAQIAARGGLDAAARLRARREARIGVWAAAGLDELADAARAALTRAALDVLDPTDTAHPGDDGDDTCEQSGPALVLTTPADAAEHTAPWLAAGAEHLVVLVEPDSCTVGPYVHPGLTACLHCVVAHRTDRDPRWPLIAAQTTRAVDGAPRCDPALAAQALAAAALDLCRAVEGDLPRSWSASRHLRFDSADEQVTNWTRHPACGCAWDSWPG